MSNLKVGAGKVCINPTDDMYPIPGGMTDFGLPIMFQEEKYDDIHVRSIAIDNEKERTMIISFELGRPPEIPGLVEDIAEATGFSKDNIFIVATHNHTDPRLPRVMTEPDVIAFRTKYDKILHDSCIEACINAVDTLRPAKFGYGETLSYTNVQRNLLTLGGYWTEARNLADYSDKTLAIIKFVDMNENLIAAFLNHATHATCCYMLKDADHKAKTSGNFTGIACRFVEEHYGNGAVALWTSGAAGDQNPLLSHGMQYEWSDGWTSQIQYPDGVGYMQMEFMGRYHGADCVKGIDAITDYDDAMPMTHVKQVVELPARKRVTELATVGGNLNHAASRGGGQGPRPDSMPIGCELPPPFMGVPVEPDEPKMLTLHLLQLADISLIFANAEIYAPIGREMKENSPYRKTVVVTHNMEKGGRVGYILDKTHKDVHLPMSVAGIEPGAGDELIAAGEKQLFKNAMKAMLN